MEFQIEMISNQEQQSGMETISVVSMQTRVLYQKIYFQKIDQCAFIPTFPDLFQLLPFRL